MKLKRRQSKNLTKTINPSTNTKKAKKKQTDEGERNCSRPGN